MNLQMFTLYINAYVWGLFLLINVLGFVLLKYVFYDKLEKRKIVELKTNHKQHIHEFKRSLISNFIFMLFGVLIFILYENDLTLIQNNWDEWGLIYFILSFFLLHSFHDTYFYWTHRAFHEIPFLKKYHLDHHVSRVPTPLAAASFSTVEALVHGGFYLLSAVIIPAHWGMLLYFYFFITWIAAWGHVEFEFWPSGLYRLPYGNTFNSLTHHNLHHYYNKGNYGLYYRFWDELCGTLHHKTYQHFYEVQKQIHGPQLSVRRPNPNDIVGLFFEEIENYGEDTGIVMSKEEKFFGLKEFSSTNVNRIPHAYCDGINSLKVLHLDLEKKILSYPNVGKFVNFEFSLNFCFDLLKQFVRHSFNFKKYEWKKEYTQNNEEAFVLTYSLTLEQTEYIKNKAKKMSASFNFLVVEAITKASHPFIEDQNWLIPVTKKSKEFSIENSPICNSVSGFEYIPNFNKSFADNQKSYLKELNSSAPYYWDLNFAVLKMMLKYPFKLLCYYGYRSTKRSGTISNLGSFKGEIEGSILFIPPTLVSCPVSIGVLTYNDELVISMQTKIKYGPNIETSKLILKNAFDSLLS